MASKFERLHGMDVKQLRDELNLIGPFDAVVESTDDPTGRGFISVRCAELNNDVYDDVEPIFPAFCFSVPKKGMFTKLFFAKGSRDLPYWMGQWYPEDLTLPDMGKPTTHLFPQVVDENLEKLFTAIYKEGESYIIQDHKHGCQLEFDIQTGAIYIDSDRTPDGQGQAKIYLNGRPAHRPVARQFDKTMHIDPILGIPVEGIIKDGSTRVSADM